jgi:hypothetical protein
VCRALLCVCADGAGVQLALLLQYCKDFATRMVVLYRRVLPPMPPTAACQPLCSYPPADRGVSYDPLYPADGSTRTLSIPTAYQPTAAQFGFPAKLRGSVSGVWAYPAKIDGARLGERARRRRERSDGGVQTSRSRRPCCSSCRRPAPLPAMRP